MLAAAALSALAPGQVRPTHDGHIALFGGMHHHSALSDDVPIADRPQMSPVQAWDYARTHGLDFMALTDHHKATDAPANPIPLPFWWFWPIAPQNNYVCCPQGGPVVHSHE